MQPCEAGARLISLPRRLQLTYDAGSDAALLALISRVPEELWGAKLALQVLHPHGIFSVKVSAVHFVWHANIARLHSPGGVVGPGICGRQSAMHAY